MSGAACPIVTSEKEGNTLPVGHWQSALRGVREPVHEFVQPVPIADHVSVDLFSLVAVDALAIGVEHGNVRPGSIRGGVLPHIGVVSLVVELKEGDMLDSAISQATTCPSRRSFSVRCSVSGAPVFGWSPSTLQAAGPMSASSMWMASRMQPANATRPSEGAGGIMSSH
jgi:hypothetical protein